MVRVGVRVRSWVKVRAGVLLPSGRRGSCWSEGPGFGRALGARVEGCARAWQPRHVSVRSHTPNSKHSLPPCAHAATLPPAAFAVPAAGAFALAAAAP
eukprot:1369633-Prymnesium_polylepis.1